MLTETTKINRPIEIQGYLNENDNLLCMCLIRGIINVPGLIDSFYQSKLFLSLFFCCCQIEIKSSNSYTFIIVLISLCRGCNVLIRHSNPIIFNKSLMHDSRLLKFISSVLDYWFSRDLQGSAACSVVISNLSVGDFGMRLRSSLA